MRGYATLAVAFAAYALMFVAPVSALVLLTLLAVGAGGLRLVVQQRRYVIGALGALAACGVLITGIQLLQYHSSPTAAVLEALEPLLAADQVVRSEDIDAKTLLAGTVALRSVTGWSKDNGASGLAEYQGDGFWRLRRFNDAGSPYSHFSFTSHYPLRSGQPVTASFLLRHDGGLESFDFDFLTNTGSHYVPPTVVGIGDHQLAIATYAPRPEDEYLRRAFDITRFEGEWKWLDVSLFQLEYGATAHEVSGKLVTREPLTSSLLWWVGLSILALFLIAGHEVASNLLGARRTIHAIVFGLLLSGLTWHIMSQSHSAEALGFGLTADRGFRLQAFSAHPNILGHQLAFGVILLALLAPLVPRLIGFVAAAVGVLLTGSQAALLVVALAALSAAWFEVGRVKARTARYVAWCLLGGATVGGLLAVATKVGVATTSVTVRLEGWRAALHGVMTYPLVGVGMGGFSDFLQVASSEFKFPQAITHAHNALLDVLVQFGFLGLIPLVLLLFALLRGLDLPPRSWLWLVILTTPLLALDSTLFTLESLLVLTALVPISKGALVRRDV